MQVYLGVGGGLCELFHDLGEGSSVGLVPRAMSSSSPLGESNTYSEESAICFWSGTIPPSLEEDVYRLDQQSHPDSEEVNEV